MDAEGLPFFPDTQGDEGVRCRVIGAAEKTDSPHENAVVNQGIHGPNPHGQDTGPEKEQRD